VNSLLLESITPDDEEQVNSALTSTARSGAVVAATPEDAERKFGTLLTMLDNGACSVLDVTNGVFLGTAAGSPKIGLLFPGQGAGRRGDGGAVRRRFEQVDELYRTHRLPTDGDLVATAVAQPRIVTSSVAGLRVLDMLGINAVTAAGHSLGELTALHWAGAMDETVLLRTAAARGRIMAQASEGGGTMASIAAGPEVVELLLVGEHVVIAGYNSPHQTVVSGPVAAVERICALASGQGLTTVRINVSHAFHSELVAPAAVAFRAHLDEEKFEHLTGQQLRHVDVVEAMAADVDLLLEVGPGRILSGLAAEIAPAVPRVSMETDSESLSGLLHAVAAAYALGAPVRSEVLFEDRFNRPLPLDKRFRFFASPAEAAPTNHLGAR